MKNNRGVCWVVEDFRELEINRCNHLFRIVYADKIFYGAKSGDIFYVLR